MAENATDANAPVRDLGPLAWVHDELRKGLDASGACLRRYLRESRPALGGAPDVTPLRLARQHLHQGAGALEMVGLPAPARLLRAMEAAVHRLAERTDLCTEVALGTVERAGHALLEFLDALLLGKAACAVALFHQYRAVQELAGAERVHPADLWAPDWHWHDPGMPAAQTLAYAPPVRSRLDAAVLRLIKTADAAAAGELAGLSAALAAGQPQLAARSFWKACAGFFEAQALGLLEPDVYVKRAASRVLVQYAQLAKGEGEVSERLARELVFFCALAVPPDASAAPRLSAVRVAWGLQRLAPADYRAARYGRFDPQALAQLRRRITAAKEGWTALAGGEAARTRSTADALRQLADALARLHPPAGPLADGLHALAGHLASQAGPPSTELAMEVATTLLYLDAAWQESDHDEARLAGRSERLAQRLAHALQGAASEPLEPWMEALYRRVSDRQTMGSVVAELRLSLGELERDLDAFFRQPHELRALQSVPGRIAQMRGVLSVLGLDQAAQAVQGMRNRIEAFLAEAGADPGLRLPADTVESLASNFGALGLLIDMLDYQPQLAKKLFVHDEASGLLEPVMGRVPAASPWSVAGQAAADVLCLPAAAAVPPDDAHAPGPAAATGLAPVQPAPGTPHAAGAAAPEAPEAPTPQMPEWAIPVSDSERQLLLEHAEPLAPASVPSLPPLPAPVPAALPANQAEQDDELLSIFLEEALEVAKTARSAVDALQRHPDDLGELSVLRRCFHTFKGSARMVGLQEFGQAGWAMEQVLNACLADQQPAPEALLALCARALDGFERWTGAIAANDAGEWHATMFCGPADAWRERGQIRPFVFPGDDPAAGSSASIDAQVEVIELDESAFSAFQVDLPPAPDTEPAESPFPAAEPIESFEAEAAEPIESFEAEPIGRVGLLGAEGIGSIASMEPVEDRQPQAAAPEVAQDREAAGGIAGSPIPPEPDPGAGPTTLGPDIAAGDAPAASLAAPAAPEAPPDPAAAAESLKVIGPLRIGIPLYNVFLNEADEWSRRLQVELSEWALELARPIPDSAVALAHSLAGSSATVGFEALSRIARALENALQRTASLAWGTTRHAEAFNAAAEEIRWLLHQFAAGFLKDAHAGIEEDLLALQALDVPLRADLAFAASAPAPLPHAPGSGQEAVDPDLFEIFEDEAAALLPLLAGALRQWKARPENRSARDAMLRGLHTLKGSARLAGAMALGDQAHHMESLAEQIDPDTACEADIEPLVSHFDQMQAGFDALRAMAQPGATPITSPSSARAGAPPAPPEAAAAAPARGALAAPVRTLLAGQRAAANQAVRVRTQLLDRLMNQAGEVMITRARLETELKQLRSSLHDLTGNLDRLRSQLRDIELQAETQMQSRLAQTRDSASGFDPLEFDRFTRVQELTRMMAESVNDVATVQRQLQRAVEATEDDLLAQARQTRELQRDLLRTRMVDFESIADRLYRVVRQAAKDTARQVRLDIEGGSIEMDRGVLDRMTPAFEHLLRNCVAHGIEDPHLRAAAGKDPTGRILVRLVQEGNDVSVEFGDDGAGLDLERIRERAIDQQRIGADEPLDDREAARLIFLPGFSTAAEVTELAGRGIGMDVVRSEVNALGGRIEVHTQRGCGTRFQLVLPLTTAVTQVVMVRCGGLAFGVPAGLVEIVRRAGARELQQAYNTGTFEHDGQHLPFFWSGALLQSSRRSEEPQARNVPVVVFRSAAQRVAVHLDEVLGSQEVVVKNLGPQLSRLPGLAGMTVLPSGAVVLIYNPVALSTVYGEQARLLSADHAQPDMLERAGSGLPPTAADAPSAVPLVLVVDDSITVRRVTQRLLQREGWRVALAADGLQALERLAQERPALVLSDIEMPRMDGFDLVRNIRSDARWADLPVVMITSRIAAKHREHARELGVEHYLGKPYSEEELLALVRRYAAQPVGA